MKCFWALLALLIPLVAPAAEPNPRPPNIVFILADDLGWTDAGFAGSRFYETPNLDALAASGLRFTSFYGGQTCAPGRACFLTGQYSPRTGVYTADSLERGEASARRMIPPTSRNALPTGTLTVATVLKQAGYATGFLGKWHLGQEPDNQPGRYGFDEAITTTEKHLGFQSTPPQEIPAGTYQADFLTDRAIEFIGRHPEQPFFLQVSHFAVHAPYDAKPAFLARFEKKAPAGGHRDAAYAAAIASLDESVGRLLAALDTLKLADRTLVVFASDNGGVGGYPDLDNTGRRTGVTDNAPLRGGKGMFYEGGIRVPFLARWPGVIPAKSRTAQPALHVDLFPTFLEVAGVRPPPKHVVDGVSLVPLFRDPTGHLGRDAIYWHYPGYLEVPGKTAWRTTPVGVIRAGNFKLLEFFEDNHLELYNLIEDLGEKNNLVRSLPEKAEELHRKLAAWREQLQAPMPAPKPKP